MKKKIVDCKSGITYAIFSFINNTTVKNHFRNIEVIGAENIPRDRPFILVSNHISRWDGLLVYHLIGRPSNFMVHPNELKGLQGLILRSMGAFPASSSFDLQGHVLQQAGKGEALVIFPEGDVYRDGATHPFKSGPARLALGCARGGRDLDVVPLAISYSEDGLEAKVMVAPPVVLDEYKSRLADDMNGAIRSLTERLFREVCHLRHALGCSMEKVVLFNSKRTGDWNVASQA